MPVSLDSSSALQERLLTDGFLGEPQRALTGAGGAFFVGVRQDE